jgi:hypothetical protein
MNMQASSMWNRWQASSGAQSPEMRIHQLKKGTDAEFCSKYGLTNAGAVLNRPDGFVACVPPGPAIFGFHAVGIPDPSSTLRCVMRKILCLEPDMSAPTPGINLLKKSFAQSDGEPQVALSMALFAREKMLNEQMSMLLKQLQQVETQLAHARRLSSLQDER